MTWHLKDRELEKKLIAIDPKFVSRLDRVTKDALEFEGKGILVAGVEAVEVLFALDFSITELEEVEDYNPHGWNEYPKITPPYDVMMRIDLAKKTYGLKGFYRHSEEGDCWCFADGSTLPTYLSEKINRFRPWSED